MECNRLAIDLAKQSFHVIELDGGNEICRDRRLSRKQLHELAGKLDKRVVAMEACASSHYWGRVFAAAGHEVRLIPAQHAKAFTRGQKNDRVDARAIAEAANRPGLHYVPVKTPEQQALQGVMRRRSAQEEGSHAGGEHAAWHAVRAWDHDCPGQLHRAWRGLAVEPLWRAVPVILRRELERLYREICALTRDLERLEKRIVVHQAKDPCTALLQSIPGIGPVGSALLLAAVGDGRQFANGRAMAAWLGLVPRQRSTGGKTRLGAITKRGNPALRCTIIHGARAVLSNMRRQKRPPDAFETKWLTMALAGVPSTGSSWRWPTSWCGSLTLS